MKRLSVSLYTLPENEVEFQDTASYGEILVDDENNFTVSREIPCPVCNSHNVDITLDLGLPKAALCNDCESQFFPLFYKVEDGGAWVEYK